MLRLSHLIPIAAFLLTGCLSDPVREEAALRTFLEEEKLNGNFCLYDNGYGTFTLLDAKSFSDSLYPTGQSFQLILTLMALETGLIRDDSSLLSWTSSSADSQATQTTRTLREAFSQCSTPAFQQVARSLEPKKLVSFLDTLGLYKRLAAIHPEQDPGQFWLKPNAGISLDEQIGLVKKLYFEKLPFQKRTQQLVKKLMMQETTPAFQLAYLSTLQQQSQQSTTGWLVGWVEENQHPYFFALHTQSISDRPELAATQVSLLKKVLRSKGFLAGKK